MGLYQLHQIWKSAKTTTPHNSTVGPQFIDLLTLFNLAQAMSAKVICFSLPCQLAKQS
jgi:hypothetical protein